MSLLHDSPESLLAEPATHRFRAATIDEAIGQARAELGPDVEIVEANRIRRGGVGGFFAADLGVEVAVRSAGVRSDTLGFASDDFEARLAFFDRVIDGPEKLAASGIDRLLERAALADVATSGVGSDRATIWAAGAVADAASAGSFAEHLTRQLADLDTTHRLPRRVRDADEVVAGGTPIPSERAHAERPRPGHAPVAAVRAPEHSDGAGESPTTDQRATSNRLSPHNEPTFAVQRADDLAASAIGRLVAELSDVVPTDGSRIGRLSRLTISVTAPDGAVIEMSAELNGSRDG